MNINSRKSKIKLILLISALLIAAITIIVTNEIAKTIAKEEEQKVKIWAEAIQRKANLVKFTQELFEKLSFEERKKVEVWSNATNLILSAEDEKTITFLLNIIKYNDNIPVLITDKMGVIKLTRNTDTGQIKSGQILAGEALSDYAQYPPIAVAYEKDTDQIYYKDSKIFSQLKIFLTQFSASFLSEVVSNNSSLPVLLVDANHRVIDKGNIDDAEIANAQLIEKLIQKMSSENEPIRIDLGDGIEKTIYYKNSALINQLKYYPWILLCIIGAFLFIAYYAFSTSRNAEQNLVWVGMAKETAHQLGTPISSLSAWVEYMKDQEDLDPMKRKLIYEVEKDVNRLSLISERFSKIGSAPKLEEHNVYETLNNSVDYIKSRASKKVKVELDVADKQQTFFINKALFDWVIENVLKNALDAIDGEGQIYIKYFQLKDDIIIEIKDSGKGILPKNIASIFEPGFTTKKRGWGLGLTLCKRIVENYFKGRIYIKESIINVGTTFRIEIPV
ncbi:MAG: HAMP domain-containing histidine kinase [Chitinophagales bacterium]|nr:HAMP domain-containing histidine kinase [Chitinophagales bacterium]